MATEITPITSPELARRASWFDLRSLIRELQRHTFVLLAGIVLPMFLYAIFMAYPIVRTVILSFYKWNGISPTMQYYGLQNYVDLVQDKFFMLTLGNNIKWAILTLILPVGGGLLLAVFLQSGKVYFPIVDQEFPCSLENPLVEAAK